MNMLAKLGPELQRALLMHLSPRYAMHVAQISKHFHELLNDHHEYWTRVAAHLAWREHLPFIKYSQMNLLLYCSDYARDMAIIAASVHERVVQLASLEDPADLESVNYCDDKVHTYLNLCRATWAPHVEASLEQKTRLQLHFLSAHPPPYADFAPILPSLREEECMHLPMKALARRLVEHDLQIHLEPQNNNPTTAERKLNRLKRMRKWMRDFAQLSSDFEEKQELIHELFLLYTDEKYNRGYGLTLEGPLMSLSP